MPDPIPSNPQTPAPDPFAAMAPRLRHGSPWWLWVAFFALFGAVAILQKVSLNPPDTDTPKKEAQGLGDITAPHSDELIIFGKLLLGVREVEAASVPPPTSRTRSRNTAICARRCARRCASHAAHSPPSTADAFLQFVNSSVGWEPEKVTLLAPALVDKDHPPKHRDLPKPAADRLRATVLVGEVKPAEELAWRLEDIEKSLAPSSLLHDDVRSLRILYKVPGADGKPPEQAEIDPVSRAGLEQRHGWFADLALTHGDPKAPVRAKAASDGMLLLGIGVGAFCIVGLACIGGLTFMIIGFVNSSRMRAAFARPEVAREWPVEPAGVQGSGLVDQHGWPVPETLLAQCAGSVWLETACIFLLGFLSLRLLTSAVVAVVGPQDWVIWIPLALQWTLILTIFWPVARGMSWERWRGEIGWHKGRGVLREIGAGFAAYLVTVPLYLLAALVVVILIFIVTAITGGEPPGAESNRVTEVFASGNPLEMVALLLLAVVWAPIVEESIFRGALFRHLRRRTGVFLSAALTAAAFAVVHPYPWYGWIMISVLGFSFAIMREWRGSLIPSATAHAIHNGFITTLLVLIFSLASV